LILLLFTLLLFHFFSFFFNDPPTTDIYTLSLHDALPICFQHSPATGRYVAEWLVDGTPSLDLSLFDPGRFAQDGAGGATGRTRTDRKSTRLNSSHVAISYAVFCLKKKKKKKQNIDQPRHA